MKQRFLLSILILVSSCLQGQGILRPILTSGFSTPSFDPTQLTNVKGVYYADAGANCGGACSNNSNQTAWIDQTANGNNMQYTGGPCGSNAVPAVYHTSRTPSGRAAFTYGTSSPGSDCLGFITSHNIDLTGGAASVCAITNTTSTASNQQILSGASGAFSYNQNRTKFQGADKASVAVLGAGTTAKGTGWHEICVSYDNSTLKFYLDGTSDGTVSVSNTITTVESVVAAGSTFSEGFIGDIYAITIQAAIISAGEIANMHTWAVSQAGTP